MRHRRHGPLLELVLIVAAALGLALLIQAFLVKPYRIPSASMEPTLDIGERVLVNRVNYRFEEPSRGDIVVFHPPEGAVRGGSGECGVTTTLPGQPCTRPTEKRADVNFIKRVVATPGDSISIRDGHAVINGRVQDEPFTSPCGSVGECSFPRPFKVPPDHFFMMGDNRGQSDDSRFWGPIPKKWIIGQAFFTYWPIKKVGLL